MKHGPAMNALLKTALVTWIAAGCLVCGAAGEAETETEKDCPQTASDMPPDALYGRWEARFERAEGASSPEIAGVQLSRHPEYAGSVRGTLVRDDKATAQLAGDIDDTGVLTLDESTDGTTIAALWSGDLQPGSCGRTFQGTRRDSDDDSTRPFVLHKTGDLP